MTSVPASSPSGESLPVAESEAPGPLRGSDASPPGVALSELLGQAAASADDLVRGITLDSRLVRPGDVYVALPGRLHHGAEFAPAAVAAGAVAVLTDQAGRVLADGLDRPVIVVEDLRRRMAEIAAQVYGYPHRAMTMFGITGTNGKTTTAYLLAGALAAAGRRAGLIGTIGFFVDGRPVDLPRTTVTTPESPELHKLLAVMRADGADSVVMEVSSHALALGRADPIIFDVAAFTNLGRDHLDFHGNEHEYFEAKALLFTPEHAARAVLNIDDPRGVELVERCRLGGVAAATVSLQDTSAHYHAVSIDPQPDGRLRVLAGYPDGTVEFRLGLLGDFNVRNALTALAMVHLAGIDVNSAADGLTRAQVPGRMQRVDLGPNAPVVYVDFAHTPQAVASVLDALHSRRCLVVLGCGGDRDPAKRRSMGAAAARGASVVLVTDDNPRTEDPAAIRAAVVAGAREEQQTSGSSVQILDAGDRGAAIRSALRLARSGDVVAILGKGHEVGQEIGGRVLPFSDIEVVRSVWDQLGGAA